MKLDDRQVELYSRQILLRELGGTGQRRLLASSCALVGSSADLSFVASYLAGAGIGTIGIAALDGADVDDRGTLAPLRERSPDVTVAHLDLDSPIDLGAYDVTLAVFGGDRADARASLLRGSSRVGSLSLRVPERGSAELVLLPAGSTGCLWCVRAIAPEAASPSPIDKSAESLGATMMALVALRWIAGIASDEGARALTLSPAAATWQEAQTRSEPGCVRGCRT